MNITGTPNPTTLLTIAALSLLAALPAATQSLTCIASENATGTIDYPAACTFGTKGTKAVNGVATFAGLIRIPATKG